MTPLAEDFQAIAAELKRIEAEKAKVLATPLPDDTVITAYGWLADYDPA